MLSRIWSAVLVQTKVPAHRATTYSSVGTHPDRASLTIALHAARDPVVQAAGFIADTVIRPHRPPRPTQT
jgi:hypothetical protein